MTLNTLMNEPPRQKPVAGWLPEAARLEAAPFQSIAAGRFSWVTSRVAPRYLGRRDPSDKRLHLNTQHRRQIPHDRSPAIARIRRCIHLAAAGA